MSKKEKRKLDSERRHTWGHLNPITRQSSSKKEYNRAREKQTLCID
jgi:hypothetical protein